MTFAAYPLLALLAHNISQVRWTAGIRPTVVSVLGAGILFLLLRLIYRDWHKAAYATSGLTVLFFTYGQVYNQLGGNKTPHLATWMGLAWTALAVLIVTWAVRHRFPNAALILNVISLGLTVYVLVQVVTEIPPAPVKANKPADPNAPVEALHIPAGQTPPDIYYFILDSYGRNDLLKRNLQYDNTGFIYDLQKLGFYVAQCSQSNYPRTDVSLGSSLNMGYLQDLNPAKFTPQNEDRSQLWQSILNSTVTDELKGAGYKTVAFATGFAFTEMTSADVYISPSPVIAPLTEFEVLALETTPLRHLQDLGWVNLVNIDGQRYRERTLLALNSMDRLARMAGPKFVFIHLVIPHPPFVFATDGTPLDPSKYMDENGIYSQVNYYAGYRLQAGFINDQMEKAVTTLISKSRTPPVIIIQGDHAPWLQTNNDEFKILNAYYLPGHEDKLYPTISPVNSFRLVLDTYLGGDYPLLEDKSYYSPIPHVFDFAEAPSGCK